VLSLLHVKNRPLCWHDDGILENTLCRWRDDFMATGKTDYRDRQIAELKKQLAERDKMIRELTIASTT